MNDVGDIGRILLLAAGVLAIAGVLLIVAGRIPGLGQLPGDIVYRRGNTTIYVPLLTMLILSLILTIALNLFLRR